MQSRVITSEGIITGERGDGYDRFLGIPYAQAPVGKNRFALPQPIKPRSVSFDAREFGPTPPAIPPTLTPAYISIPGDDWLNLNIWCPIIDENRDEKIPVLLWFHGGSFVAENSAFSHYDGASFARSGIIFVSCNYRLGVEGYAVFPDAPANRGLADQIAALKWVSNNIAAFGGDPAAITLCGQSAGAISVLAILATQQAQGLYRQAIISSGPPVVFSLESRKKYIQEIADYLDIEATAAAFSQISPAEINETIIHIRKAAHTKPLSYESVMTFGPVIDGIFLHDDWQKTDGFKPSTVPILIGTTIDEFRPYIVSQNLFPDMNWSSFSALLIKLGIPAEIGDKYFAYYHATHSARDALCQLISDAIFVAPTYFYARQYAGPVFSYRFHKSNTVGTFGSGHGVDLGFIFHNLDSEISRFFTGENFPIALADDMHNAWVQFVRTGNPGWSEFHPGNAMHIFSDVPDEVAGISIELLGLWENFHLW